MVMTGKRPADLWSPATARFRRLTATGMLLAAVPVLILVFVPLSVRSSSLIAGLVCMLLLAVLLITNRERQRRSMASKRLDHHLMAVGFTLIFGLEAAGYVFIAFTGRPLLFWAYDLPLVLGIIPFAAGLIGLCWPPALTRRETLHIAADAVTTGCALLVIWVLIVIPADSVNGAAPFSPVQHIAPWAQYIALLALAVVAATTRRPGALPIRQLILLQAGVLVYVMADILQHLLDVRDHDVAVSLLVVGAWVATALFRFFAQRPALEDEDAAMRQVRVWWSAAVPVAVLIAMGVTMVSYRIQFGAVPVAAFGLTAAAVCAASLAHGLQRVLLMRDSDLARTARLHATLEESAKAQWFGALLGQTHDLVTVVDRDGAIVFQTPSVTALLGYPPDAMRGQHGSLLFQDLTRGEFDRLLQESLHTTDQSYLERVMVDSEGAPRETETVILPLRAEGSDGYVLTARDVTDRVRWREALVASGQTDALTGLLNRSGFLASLKQVLSTGGSDVAVLLVDIVGFREINETRGQDVGDAVLRAVAVTLRKLSTSITVTARIGADEFAIVVQGDDLHDTVTAIDRAMRESLRHLGPPMPPEVAFCLGYTTAGEHLDAADLLAQADLALSAARSRGARTAVRYERGMRSALVSRMQLQAELRKAVEGDGIVVHYQPVIETLSGRLVGVEALVRLRDPAGGLIPPGDFIGQAEEMGLIGQLGQRVLECALGDLGLICQAVERDVTVAVNFSADQIDSDLPSLVAAALDRHRTPARQLIVEVTESSLVRHPDAAPILDRLRASGCLVAIDDFGTGYSSLSYLVGLPVDVLKIDRSFVGQLAVSPRALSLVRVLLQMASTLGLKVVAEGVETVEQADLLRGMGCERAQGFLYAAPMDLEVLLSALRQPESDFGIPR